MAYLSERREGRYGVKQTQKARLAQRRVSLLTLLGGECARCGENDHRCLQIDHVDGGGCHERHLDGHKSYAIADAWSGGLEGKYQVLCANCNWKKRYEQNEHRFLTD